jgi:hypothetical protein
MHPPAAYDVRRGTTGGGALDKYIYRGGDKDIID